MATLDAAQCHRCQRFGHGSRNCTLAPKCVKCGAAHLTGQCTLPQKASLGIESNAEKHKPLVKCANCQGNHTANHYGCPARRTFLNALEKQRKKTGVQQPPRITISTQSTPSDHPAPPGVALMPVWLLGPAALLRVRKPVQMVIDSHVRSSYLKLSYSYTKRIPIHFLRWHYFPHP